MEKYSLEIIPPGNKGHDVTCYIESNDPFLPIQRGDLINPRTWTHHYVELLHSFEDPGKYGIILRVTCVEHMIIQHEKGFSQHKIRLFTEALPDIEESRT